MLLLDYLLPREIHSDMTRARDSTPLNLHFSKLMIGKYERQRLIEFMISNNVCVCARANSMTAIVLFNYSRMAIIDCFPSRINCKDIIKGGTIIALGSDVGGREVGDKYMCVIKQLNPFWIEKKGPHWKCRLAWLGW